MSKRIERVDALIEKELGQIILREVEFPVGSLVTITRVKCSADLANARVYVSVLPQNLADRVLYILDKLVFVLQKFLDKRLRIRPIPKIRFVKEEQTEEAAKIEGLLKKIEKKS